MHDGAQDCVPEVIRRVGGLEGPTGNMTSRDIVIRRVGGLEVRERGHSFKEFVIRRVGGLEVTVGAFLRLPLT